MKYKHFSVEEREKIQRGLWEQRSIRSIAKDLNRTHSSVVREIQRNRPPERNQYTPRVANERAIKHRLNRGREERLKNEEIREYVISHLKKGWSPEQISGTMKTDIPNQSISPEAIYQYIYARVNREGRRYMNAGEDLRIYLKRRHKKRIKKGMRKGQRIFRPHGPSIDSRPKDIERRRSIGHWEGDLVVSGKNQTAIQTLVERKTGIVLISKVENGRAQTSKRALISRFEKLPPSLRQTLTLDNGSENAHWSETQKILYGTKIYFAHPYHSWERGTNENTNGLIRWYFPKKTDFAMISDEEIAFVERELNSRPRKRLGWKTPLQIWSGALRS